MKLIDIINKSRIISENLFSKAISGKFATVVISIQGKGGKADITFDVKVGPFERAYSWIVLDFVPKGKKMQDLATEIAGYGQSLDEQKAIGEQIAKWVSKKTKPFTAYEHYSIRSSCRISIDTNSIIKKIK
jgi:hypothetical protein